MNKLPYRPESTEQYLLIRAKYHLNRMEDSPTELSNRYSGEYYGLGKTEYSDLLRKYEACMIKGDKSGMDKTLMEICKKLDPNTFIMDEYTIKEINKSLTKSSKIGKALLYGTFGAAMGAVLGLFSEDPNVMLGSSIGGALGAGYLGYKSVKTSNMNEDQCRMYRLQTLKELIAGNMAMIFHRNPDLALSMYKIKPKPAQINIHMEQNIPYGYHSRY